VARPQKHLYEVGAGIVARHEGHVVSLSRRAGVALLPAAAAAASRLAWRCCCDHFFMQNKWYTRWQRPHAVVATVVRMPSVHTTHSYVPERSCFDMSSMRVTSGASAPVFVVAENPAAVAILWVRFFMVEAREGDPKNVTAKSQLLCFVTRGENFAAQSHLKEK
jgi:hypothetical protein